MRQILSIVFLLSINISIAQTRQFFPSNETIKDESLSVFIKKLKTAVQKKDTTFIYASLSPNIRNTFGGDENGSIKEFKDFWKLEKSNTEFWYKIDRVLSMPGCYTSSFSNDKSDYSFPYVFCFQPKGNEDVFEMALITGKDVALRQNPSFNSKTLLNLEYNVVSFVFMPKSDGIITKGKNEVNDPEWYLITVQNGKKKLKGWVYYKYIYSPVSYRLILGKENDKWLIQAFVAGD